MKFADITVCWKNFKYLFLWEKSVLITSLGGIKKCSSLKWVRQSTVKSVINNHFDYRNSKLNYDYRWHKNNYVVVMLKQK